MKQETLEEAAEKYIAGDNSNRYYNDFINGAKWQQERSYSEKEVYILIHKRDVFWKTYKSTYNQDYISPKEWFEQFKKK
jgi:hypothetical protein